MLVDVKSTEGILYWLTDTHWNQRGSYVAFKLMMEKLDLQAPNVEFKQSGKKYSGDLIRISKSKDFPLGDDDDWNYKISVDSQIAREELIDQPKDDFGWKGKVVNEKALNNMSVWVIGDSFTNAIRPYIEASFKEVRYIGYWTTKLNSLPLELTNSDEKPDFILVEMVERYF